MKNAQGDKNKQPQAESKPVKKDMSKVELAKLGQLDANELSKAKQKKLKKLVKETEAAAEFRCNVCKLEFPSKTKLFKHCDKEKHHLAA